MIRLFPLYNSSLLVSSNRNNNTLKKAKQKSLAIRYTREILVTRVTREIVDA